MRMFWPVTASVATTLAAFLPLMFWPGMVGKFMRYLPVTVFAVLCGSLLYSSFCSALGAVMGRVGSEQGEFMKKLNALDGSSLANEGALGLYVGVVASAAKKSGEYHRPNADFPGGTLIAYGQYGRGVIFLLVRTSVHADTRQCSWQLFSGRDDSLFQDVERPSWM